jgi:hypothetical protein
MGTHRVLSIDRVILLRSQWWLGSIGARSAGLLLRTGRSFSLYISNESLVAAGVDAFKTHKALVITASINGVSYRHA